MAKAICFAQQGKQYPHVIAKAAALHVHLLPELQHKLLMQWGHSVRTTSGTTLQLV